METKRTPLDFVLNYTPPVLELVIGFFGLAVISVLFGLYLAADASLEWNPTTRQLYLLQFSQPSLGPDRIVTRYGTYAQMIGWRTVTVAMDMTLVLGVLAAIWAAVMAGLRKVLGR